MTTTDNIIFAYSNGGYDVTLFEDGTKVRQKVDDSPPIQPESMDIKITNQCDLLCPYCHESSVPSGNIGDIETTLHNLRDLEYCELAIGGGNPVWHPHLMEFLVAMRDQHNVCNMTINEQHLKEPTTAYFVDTLLRDKLLYGIGVSWAGIGCFKHPNAVGHVIAGIHSFDEIQAAFDHFGKILILGYKRYGRGRRYETADILDGFHIRDKMDELERNLFRLFNQRDKVVAFDNLALEQMCVKEYFSGDGWDKFYMGNDGKFTMYYDAVLQQYAISSTAPRELVRGRTASEYFRGIQNEGLL